MSYSAGEELDSKVGSRYSLVIAVAKRAKQLREGQPRLVDCKSKNHITVALEEIASGRLQVTVPTEEEIRAEDRHGLEPLPVVVVHKDTSELLKVPETLEGMDDVEADLSSQEIAETEIEETPAEGILEDETESDEDQVEDAETEEAETEDAESSDDESADEGSAE